MHQLLRKNRQPNLYMKSFVDHMVPSPYTIIYPMQHHLHGYVGSIALTLLII